MNSINDLVKMTETKDNTFGTVYNHLIEWLFNEYIKTHETEIDKDKLTSAFMDLYNQYKEE